MKAKRLASTVLAAIALAVPALAVAAPAHADPDTDFYNELHIYGIYGEKDYNAWIGKIACKRLWNNLDQDANASAKFVKRQLHKDTTTEQTYQFLGAALRTYCPGEAADSHTVGGADAAATGDLRVRRWRQSNSRRRQRCWVKRALRRPRMSVVALTIPAVASADATDDYPIPNRILKTTCTVDQYMAATRDTDPIYYERYMIDYHNRPVDVQNGARDRIYWFFSLDYAGTAAVFGGHRDQRLLRADGNALGQLGEAVLQQQGRRRPRHRCLHELPAERSDGLGLDMTLRRALAWLRRGRGRPRCGVLGSAPVRRSPILPRRPIRRGRP